MTQRAQGLEEGRLCNRHPSTLITANRQHSNILPDEASLQGRHLLLVALRVFEQVSVAIEGHLDGRVPQERLDFLWGKLPGLDQQAGRGVSERVQAILWCPPVITDPGGLLGPAECVAVNVVVRLDLAG